MPLTHPQIAQRWFTFPNIVWFSPVPLLVGLCVWQLLARLKGAPNAGPFVLTLCIIFLGYSGLGISLFPHIIPPAVTIWDARRRRRARGSRSWRALLIIPMILGYTAWSYYVFRGKVDASHAYH